MDEKRYFVWKDGKQAIGKTQEWTEISKQEYRKICDDSKRYAPNQRRYFVRIPGVEHNDTWFWFECDYGLYKKYRAEKEQKARSEQRQEKVTGKEQKKQEEQKKKEQTDEQSQRSQKSESSEKEADELPSSPVRAISLDAARSTSSGSEYTLHELVSDETSLFEDSLIDRIAVESAMAQLNSQERNLIEALFSNGDKKMNDTMLSHQIHVPRTTLNYRKRRIYEKLKKFFVKN